MITLEGGVIFDVFIVVQVWRPSLASKMIGSKKHGKRILGVDDGSAVKNKFRHDPNLDLKKINYK